MYRLLLEFYATVNTAAGYGKAARRYCLASKYLPRDYMSCPLVGQTIQIECPFDMGIQLLNAKRIFHVASISTMIGPSYLDKKCGRNPALEALETITLKLSLNGGWPEEILNTEDEPKAGEHTLELLDVAGFKVTRERPS